MCLLKFGRWCQTSSTLLFLNPKPEKLLLDMRLKIDSLTKESDRLEGVVRTRTTELHAAL